MSIKRMLKKVLFFCTCIIACSGRQAIQAEENTVVQKNEVTIDESIFPDRYFRQEIARQADQNEDGMLSREEMQNVTELTISYPHQTFDNKRNDCDSVFLLPGGEHSFDGARIDFTGIELFTNLEILSLHNLEPQNVPFAELVKLKAFYLASAPAIELDFSGAGNLKIMAVLYTQLKGIDLKENHKLEDLRVQSCGLSQIDLTGCKNLQKLDVSYNNIQDLDLSKNSKLDLRHLKNLRVLELDSENEVLAEADLSGNLKLEIPFMPWENMKKLTVSRKISSGDLKYYMKMMKKGNGKLIVV